MPETSELLPIVQKLFEQDIVAAACSLESMVNRREAVQPRMNTDGHR